MPITCQEPKRRPVRSISEGTFVEWSVAMTCSSVRLLRVVRAAAALPAPWRSTLLYGCEALGLIFAWETSMIRVMTVLAVLVLLTGTLCAGPPQAPLPPQGPSPPQCPLPASDNAVRRAASLKQTVCGVWCNGGWGTGTLIAGARKDGKQEVLTAAHVASPPGAYCMIVLEDGRKLDASVASCDTIADVAWLLTKTAVKLDGATLAARGPRVGDIVRHFGRGSDRRSGCAGKVVSASNERIWADYPRASGDSGAGLFSPVGELVALHVAYQGALRYGPTCEVAARIRPGDSKQRPALALSQQTVPVYQALAAYLQPAPQPTYQPLYQPTYQPLYQSAPSTMRYTTSGPQFFAQPRQAALNCGPGG